MPEITRFYGIIIKIFFGNEHNPPHFHALYGENNAEISLKTGEMIEGDLPIRAQKLVKEWWELHKDEVQQMWDCRKVRKLPPLK